MTLSNTKLKEFELVVPGWSITTIRIMKASDAILHDGPNLVDPLAVAEVDLDMEAVEELKNVLEEVLKMKRLRSFSFYIREKKKSEYGFDQDLARDDQ